MQFQTNHANGAPNHHLEMQANQASSPQLDKPGVRLNALQPYPFERLRALFQGVEPNASLSPINISIGEPKHPTPSVITSALQHNLQGLSTYPSTQGLPKLRTAIGDWINRRFGAMLDPNSQILPVLGTREALFSVAQALLNPVQPDDLVLMPNPFYQIYEGAALLAGAKPYFLNLNAETGLPDLNGIEHDVLQHTRMMYVCSPNNPTGAVHSLADWQQLFDWADEFNFILLADECYSEIYFDEAEPPLGALEAATRLGRTDFDKLLVFSSLSKRSNAPGLRSGYVAGDAALIQRFLLYRTYHGSAMSVAIQEASAAAWNDEEHVTNNRGLYRESFARVTAILNGVLPLKQPIAGFYHWLKVPESFSNSDTDFALALYRDANITVLPGQFLGRTAHGINPGVGFVRLAWVSSPNECEEAASRILKLITKHS